MCFGIHGDNEIGIFNSLILIDRLDLLPEVVKRTTFSLEQDNQVALSHNTAETTEGVVLERVSLFGTAGVTWIVNPEPGDHPAQIQEYIRRM